MEQPLSNALLLEKLRELRQSIDGVRDGQAEMKDDLHGAMLENAKAMIGLEARMRVNEASISDLKRAARASAGKWAAGIATIVTAAVQAFVHFWGVKQP